MKDIKFTIITVCKNAEKVIGKTIQSVVTQTYKNIEYIIIDGASIDDTLSIIHKYEKIYPIIYISEQDQGIYDAMNKGIKMATGDYIQFLNAGDSLYERTTIKNVADEIQKNQADIYYGDVAYLYSDQHTEVRKYGKWCSKRLYDYTGDCINHQVIFAKTHLLKEHNFDINYKICADREWIMRVRSKGAVFFAIGKLICYYSLDEESTSIFQKERYEKEADECIRKYYSYGYMIFRGFQFFRSHKILRNWLHNVYKLIYIRKK